MNNTPLRSFLLPFIYCCVFFAPTTLAQSADGLDALAKQYESVHTAFVRYLCDFDGALIQSVEGTSNQQGHFQFLRYADIYGDRNEPILQFAAYDGNTLYTQNEPYLYVTTTPPPFEDGIINANLLEAPWPIIPAFARRLADADDLELTESRTGIIAQSNSVGVSIEWRPVDGALLSITRLHEGKPLIAKMFSGFDSNTPPRPTYIAVVIGEGNSGIDPETYLIETIDFNRADAQQRLAVSVPAGYSRIDPKTRDVFDVDGTFEYNANELDAEMMSALGYNTPSSLRWIVPGVIGAAGLTFILWFIKHRQSA